MPLPREVGGISNPSLKLPLRLKQSAMENKIVLTPIAIGGIILALGGLLALISHTDIFPADPEMGFNFGIAGIFLGICIIFIVLAISASHILPLFIFTMVIAIVSFVIFVIFLVKGINVAQETEALRQIKQEILLIYTQPTSSQ
jgi:hypothetical protein